MLVIPVLVGGALATGGGLVCWRGVTTESGTSPGGRWRIRWACWRWLSEKQIGNDPWKRIGAFSMRQKGLAKTAAMTSVALPAMFAAQAEPPMVRLIRGHREPE